MGLDGGKAQTGSLHRQEPQAPAVAGRLHAGAVSREMISQMEQGKYSIRISVLLALKELYHAEFADFFEGLEL